MRDKLYENLYLHIIEEIRKGNLKAGAKLPSVRRCADDNGVSRNTVLGAYSLLISEGYIYAKEKSGYYVADFESPLPARTQGNPRQEKQRETFSASTTDLSANLVDSSLFPYSTLKRLYRQTLSGENISILENPGSFLGEWDLRQSIASYVFNYKSIECEASQVVVGNGTSYLLQILSSLFEERPVFLMETPGFENTRDMVRDSGCEILDIPVDDEGASISATRALKDRIGDRSVFLHISPSHQFPLGTTMTAPRRAAFLNWAGGSKNRYIVEDDYDSEFRYNGHPIKSIRSMDTEGHVIYLGTFSRTLTPSIRISYMILPEPLLKRYEERYRKYPCPVSRIDQKVISLFMDGGYYERHINRMRRQYRAKRNRMLEIIQQNAPGTLIKGEEAGLHFIARFPLEESTLIERARKEGFKLQGTGTGWIIIGYAHLSEEEMIGFGFFLNKTINCSKL